MWRVALSSEKIFKSSSLVDVLKSCCAQDFGNTLHSSFALGVGPGPLRRDETVSEAPLLRESFERTRLEGWSIVGLIDFWDPKSGEELLQLSYDRLCVDSAHEVGFKKSRIVTVIDENIRTVTDWAEKVSGDL